MPFALAGWVTWWALWTADEPITDVNPSASSAHELPRA
jgi:hypothetical protein